MEKIISKLKEYYAAFMTWCRANMPVVYLIGAAIAAFFIIPYLYKKFFKRRRVTRRRRTAIRRPSLRRGKAGTGKGSDYMRRKMARLRAMRRRKRK